MNMVLTFLLLSSVYNYCLCTVELVFQVCGLGFGLWDCILELYYYACILVCFFGFSPSRCYELLFLFLVTCTCAEELFYIASIDFTVHLCFCLSFVNISNSFQYFSVWCVFYLVCIVWLVISSIQSCL